ncbi:MAG: LysR substrate-binding domain-containing protein, partial [Bacteroidota bacterium]|nr:LysR substrate-binding domain-containing protein [Bacteroidota bacterium]
LMLDVTNKLKVVESLEKNEVDFSLVSVLPNNIQVENIELMQNKLYLISNTKNKYDIKVYDKSIFETIPLIYREQGSGTRQVMEQFIEQNSLPVRKKMELTTNEAVKQSVIAGLGSSIMPLIGIKNELHNGILQIIPVKDFPIISVWNLIWQKGKNHSPVAAAFLSYVLKEKDNIIRENFAWIEQYY